MQLTVTRRWFSGASTVGILSVDGVFQCYTLEPRADQSNGKPYCIPLGSYKIALSWSRKFQTIMPHVLDVPGFTEIEIHWGNYPRDTEGCLLVGLHRYDDLIGGSRVAWAQLMEKLKKAQGDILIAYEKEKV